MTNTQLLLSIGIPSVLVVLAWLSSNTRLSSLEQRLEARLAAHDRRFDEVISANHRDSLELMRSMTALHVRVAVVESKQGA